jgi:hypothetical protein
MSLIIKKNTTFKIPRTGSGAPTTLPLSTPNLYLSGLSFTANFDNYINPTFGNPLIRQSNTVWGGVNSPAGLLVSSGNVWYLYVGCEQYTEEEGWQYSFAEMAQNYSGTASIPLTGWIYIQTAFAITGTLVISTTP